MSFLLYASYAPLSSFVHSSSKNSKKRKTIPISYRQLLNFFFFSYYDTCIVCTIQTAHLSRRRKFIYMPVRMKGEKFTRCIKIYIRVSSWGHSTNEKSPYQFSNFHLPPHFLQFLRQNNLGYRAVDHYSMQYSCIGHSHSHYGIFSKGLALVNCALLTLALSFVLPCHFFRRSSISVLSRYDNWAVYRKFVMFFFHSFPWFHSPSDLSS